MSPFPAAPAAVAVVGELLVDLANAGGPEFVALPGGAPANVAVALSRLGVPTELLARISSDSFGRLVREHLAANRVGIRFSAPASEPTTLAVAMLSADNAATYSFYTQGTADWQWTPKELPEVLPRQVRALVTGSLAFAMKPGAEVLEEFVANEYRRSELFIAYDPNIRPTLASSRQEEASRVERQITRAHLVKASEEDLAFLYPTRDFIEVAHRWQEACRGWVVVTRGAKGAYSVCPSGEAVLVAGREVQVVDTIGAGDAFLAGLLAVMVDLRLFGTTALVALQGLTASVVEQAIDYAGAVAALTCGRPGADPPSREEVRRMVEDRW
jgi:fructokinase